MTGSVAGPGPYGLRLNWAWEVNDAFKRFARTDLEIRPTGWRANLGGRRPRAAILRVEGVEEVEDVEDARGSSRSRMVEGVEDGKDVEQNVIDFRPEIEEGKVLKERLQKVMPAELGSGV